MFWDWVFNIFYWRSNRQIAREMDALCADNQRMVADLDRRIREVFTPEEWAAVSERCEKQLRSGLVKFSD